MWKFIDELPRALFERACNAVNALRMTGEIPSEWEYQFKKHKGNWWVFFWLPGQPENMEAFPLSDILADGAEAEKQLQADLAPTLIIPGR